MALSMSDIFVSYASPDRDKARALAGVLGAKGWSVWWDRTIPPGKEFDEVIEDALDSAKCVVVLWSKSSITSSWVKTEAADAMRRKVLVPALIEQVKIPLEFRRLHAADLSRWQDLGSPQDLETRQQLETLFQSISTLITADGDTLPPATGRSGERPEGKSQRACLSGVAEPQDEPGVRKRKFTIIAVTVGSVLAVVAALALYKAHVDQIALQQAEQGEAQRKSRRRGSTQQQSRRRGRRQQESKRRRKAAKEQAAKQAAKEQTDRQEATNTIRIITVSPSPDVSLRSGTPVGFAVRIHYRLTSADTAILGFYAERYQVSSEKCANSAIHQTEGGTDLLIDRGERDIELRLTWKEDVGPKSRVAPGAANLGLAANFWTNQNGRSVPPIIMRSGPLVCYVVKPS